MSHGEKEIVKYLDDSRIEYVPQYSFSNLRGVKGGTLSYDFYVPAHNMLIEYQGIQHYRPIAAFGGEEQFDVQLEHDERKRLYANENGYLLVEIRYDQINNIANILNTVLNQNTISNPCIDHSL
jgi:very-short-patch-repair endonuclease